MGEWEEDREESLDPVLPLEKPKTTAALSACKQMQTQCSSASSLYQSGTHKTRQLVAVTGREKGEMSQGGG